MPRSKDPYMKFRLPVNFVLSVPPKVSPPFVAVPLPVEGSNEIPMIFSLTSPCANALSRTVGTVPPPKSVPFVKSVGPSLWKSTMSEYLVGSAAGHLRTYPRIPSKPLKPSASKAAPMLWLGTVSCPTATVSVYSSPKNNPEPYATNYMTNARSASM